MARPKRTTPEQEKQKWDNVLGDISKRIIASIGEAADTAGGKMNAAARESAKSWYDVDEAIKKIGTSQYQNIDYSTKMAANAKELWEIEEGIHTLKDDDLAARKSLLEQDQLDLGVLQGKAKVLNQQNAILMRGNALIDGAKKHWKEIENIVISTVTTWQGAVVTSMALNKHVGGIAQNLGVAHTEAMGFAASGALLGPMFKAMGLDVQASQKALLDNFNSMGEANIKNVAHMGLLQIQTGLTADEAGKAARMFSLIEGSSASAGLSMTKQVSDQAKLAGAIPAKVIADMTANSEKIAEYWVGNVESLTAAAAQASKLGLSISSISEAAGKMLDIESSIAAEMEAEVLLGRQLNLDKAREAALTGDSETLMKELVKNAGSLAEFNSMNVIQRQKLAAALGITVGDMQKMVQEEEKSTDFWAKISGHASSTATWISAAVPGMMKMANSASKLKDNFGGPVMKALSKVGIGGGAAPTDISSTVSKGGEAAAKGGDKMVKTGSAAGGAAMNMIKGAAAMLIMGAALWVAAKGFQELAKVDWPALWPGAVIALIGITGALVGLGAIMASGIGGAAILAGAGALLLFGIALMAIGKGLQFTRDGLNGFAAIMTELIPLVPGMLGLAHAFGTMGLGLMSMSAGLLLMAPMLPVIMAIGAIAKLGGGIGGGGATEETMEIKSTSIEDKLDALTMAILTQPISISIDGKELATRTEMAHNRAIDVV